MIIISKEIREIIGKAGVLASDHEYITPEHIMVAMCENERFKNAFTNQGGNLEELKNDLLNYIDENVEEVNDLFEDTTESILLGKIFVETSIKAMTCGIKTVELSLLLESILNEEDCFASYYIKKQNINEKELIDQLVENANIKSKNQKSITIIKNGETIEKSNDSLNQFLTNLNDEAKNQKEPIIGREDVLKRTIQILCRKQKNNPIHVGEPGVGKTAITIGLAKMINENSVPEVLKDSTLFSLDLSGLIAGAKYRGEFEERFKKLLNEVEKFKNPIIYIDEIHNIVGAGAVGNSSLDASNILKPYLTKSKIKFIGATTYDEYKKNFEKDKALVRRFQTIDVKEPSVEEAIQIINGIKQYYEEFHNVKYTDESIRAAVELSHQYINNRYLPDKAIDIIDEAGAYSTVNGKEDGYVIEKREIEEVISKVCNIPKKTIENDEIDSLKDLDQKLKEKVFGQDKAVDQIVRNIKMSRAGLGDDDKPVANLLFIGPTGTGKTEIARQLAQNLGVKLLRYDMSEYSEKHSVSKLIGAPAGYVGYEEGGQLVEDIKKNPYCVLLLDEIEKAHSDIYNILLQIMDYATLTDNQGRKANFKNVILIMTSNAGASNIGKRGIGFGDKEITYEAIDEAVKKTFSPEFIGRLTSIVTFNQIDDQMAVSIAEKALNTFKNKLEKKNVSITWTKNTLQYIAEKGISFEKGAREINRIVDNEIKPLLMDEILFGKLKSGGECKLSIEKKKIKLVI